MLFVIHPNKKARSRVFSETQHRKLLGEVVFDKLFDAPHFFCFYYLKMSKMSSVEVQHHLTNGPSTAEPKQTRSVSSTQRSPAESNSGKQSSASNDPQESNTSSKSKLKDPPPSSATPSSLNEPSQDERSDAADVAATPTNTANPSTAAEESSTPKNPAINLDCEEEMPAFFDFSDLPNPPSLNLLPHVILTLSYVAINQLLGENGSPPASAKARTNNRQRKCPQVLVGVAPTLQKLGARSDAKSKTLQSSTNSNKQPPVKKKSVVAKVIKNMKEVVRLRALGIPTEPIEKDLPLSYDWGPNSSLQLGSKTGSKAWNQIVVQHAIRHLQETNARLAEVMTYRVPQVNAVETLVALQENLSRITSAPGSFPPPPFYEYHKKTVAAAAAAAAGASTVPPKQPTLEDGVTVYMMDQLSRLYDSIKKKELDSTAYQTEISLQSADDVIRLLRQFHEKHQELDRHYKTLLDNMNRNEVTSAIKHMKSTKTAVETTGAKMAAADAEPMEIDRPMAEVTNDTTTTTAPNGTKNTKSTNGAQKRKKKSTRKKDDVPEPMDVDLPEQHDGKGESNDATDANTTKSTGLQQPPPPIDPEAWRENIRKFMAEQELSAPRYLLPHDRT